MHPKYRWVLVMLLAAAALLITGTTLASAPGSGLDYRLSGTGPIVHTYLPWLSKPRYVSVSGKVTYQGAPRGGVYLELRHYASAGAPATVVAVTATQNDGSYRFSQVPALNSGQMYRVYFHQSIPGHAINDNRFLSWWASTVLRATDNAENDGGSFDIANISLSTPASGATVRLPAADGPVHFAWSPRSATPSDTYQVNILSAPDNDLLDGTDWLGYVASTDITRLSLEIAPNTKHYWGVRVKAPNGGYGISWIRPIYFSDVAGSASNALRNADREVWDDIAAQESR